MSIIKSTIKNSLFLLLLIPPLHAEISLQGKDAIDVTVDEPVMRRLLKELNHMNTGELTPGEREKICYDAIKKYSPYRKWNGQFLDYIYFGYGEPNKLVCGSIFDIR